MRPRAPRAAAIPMGCAAALFCAYALVLFTHPAPPSLTDFATWTYEGVLFQRHLLHLPDATHALKPYPVPNSAATVGIGLLNLLLPWKLAAKLWLCLEMLASFLVTRHMMRTTGATTLLWLIVPAVTYLNVNLWYGFVNFQLGLCWVVLCASLLLRMAREPSAGTRQEGTVGLLLVLAFFTHMIPFAFCCLMLLLYVRQTQRRRVLWQVLPGALLTLGYVCGRFLLDQNHEDPGMQSPVAAYTPDFWLFKANSYLKSFGLINPMATNGSLLLRLFGDAGFAVFFLLNTALALFLGVCLVRAASRSLSSGPHAPAAERFLWQAILFSLPIYLLLPGTALGVSDPGARLLQVALALALMLIPQASSALRASAVCASALGLAGFFLFARLACSPEPPSGAATRLPAAVVMFNHVAYLNQQELYDALERGDFSRPVFATSLFEDLPHPSQALPSSPDEKAKATHP